MTCLVVGSWLFTVLACSPSGHGTGQTQALSQNMSPELAGGPCSGSHIGFVLSSRNRTAAALHTCKCDTRAHAHTQQLFLCSNGLLGPGTALSLPVLKPFHSCRGWVDYVSSRKLQLLNGNAVLNCWDGKRGGKNPTSGDGVVHSAVCTLRLRVSVHSMKVIC